MSILIDSAKIDEIRRAMELGYVNGVTTNPSLMAKASDRPQKVIEDICAVSRGPVFYQVTAETVADREKEGREVHSICPERVVLKIPATGENMKLLAGFTPEIPCAATAVFASHQAYVACEAGAKYLIPYVNRATRQMGDGLGLLAEIAAIAEAVDSGAELLAASIKSPGEATAAVLAGADHLTLPLDVITALGDHVLSDQAIAQFNQDLARGRS